MAQTIERTLAELSERVGCALDQCRDEGGMVSAGFVIEGALNGIACWLQRELGPAVAYEALQRTCDAIARRLADDQSALKGSQHG
jgi:hypothetical protein